MGAAVHKTRRLITATTRRRYIDPRKEPSLRSRSGRSRRYTVDQGLLQQIDLSRIRGGVELQIENG